VPSAANRLIVLLSAFALLGAASACERASKTPATKRTATQPSNADLVAAWDRATQGRVIARAESRFMVIENDSCPGTRTVTSRFEQAGEALLQLTEDNAVVQCSEGTRSRPTVLIWRKPPYRGQADTIHVYEPWIRSFAEVLIEGTSEGGMLPSENAYYSIETGKLLFRSQFRAAVFDANARRRFLGVVGGRDTMATVAYSTHNAVKQVLHIANPHDASTREVAEFIVDSMSLDGPGRQCCNNITLGLGSKDTVPVSGITLTFWLGSDGEGVVDFPSRRFVVRIVNDRLVLDSGARK
jgi:hypothetical protein